MEQSDDSLRGFVVVCVVVLVVVLVVRAIRRARRLERERQQRLADWARHHDWTYAYRPAAESTWSARLPGRSRRGVSVVLSGMADGYPVTVAEYSYVTSSTGTDASGRTTSSETTHRLIVAVVRRGQAFPPVEVAPRSAVSRFTRSMFGEGQIATGDSEFDRRFRIKSPEPGTARALVGQALISAHLAERVPGWSLYGEELMTCQQGVLRGPEGVAPLLNPLLEVARLLRR